MAKTARAVSKRRLTRPSFHTLVKHYQQDLEKSLQAADPDERGRARQRTLSPYHLAHLQRCFGKRPLTSIDTAAATDYAMRRREAGEADDVVDDELRALSRLLTFAVKQGWLQQCPTIWLVPRPRPALTPVYRPLRDEAFPRRRWFGHTPVPSTGSLPSKGKAQRRGYLERPYGPDSAVPMDTLRKLAAAFEHENPGKLRGRLNDAFPGLNASSKTIYTAVGKIRSSSR
jgi:hypothetical protein